MVAAAVKPSAPAAPMTNPSRASVDRLLHEQHDHRNAHEQLAGHRDEHRRSQCTAAS